MDCTKLPRCWDVNGTEFATYPLAQRHADELAARGEPLIVIVPRYDDAPRRETDEMMMYRCTIPEPVRRACEGALATTQMLGLDYVYKALEAGRLRECEDAMDHEQNQDGPAVDTAGNGARDGARS